MTKVSLDNDVAGFVGRATPRDCAGSQKEEFFGDDRDRLKLFCLAGPRGQSAKATGSGPDDKTFPSDSNDWRITALFCGFEP
jgi:hypothetical protein